jgi:hypothetical protein
MPSKNTQKIGNSFPRPLPNPISGGAPTVNGGMKAILAILNLVFVSVMLGSVLYLALRVVSVDGSGVSITLSLWRCVVLALFYTLWRLVVTALLRVRD